MMIIIIIIGAYCIKCHISSFFFLIKQENKNAMIFLFVLQLIFSLQPAEKNFTSRKNNLNYAD